MGQSGLQYLQETGEVEIDFLLGREFWGQRCATQAAELCPRHAREGLRLHSVVGIAHPENKASQRVLEKTGMRFVEEAQYFGMACDRYVIKWAAPDRVT